MKPCPFCAELIQDAAIKCKHCGSLLTASPSADTQVSTTPTLSRSTISSTPTRMKGSSEDELFETGSVFAGRYEILSQGKKGGMGVVYKVEDTKLDKVV